MKNSEPPALVAAGASDAGRVREVNEDAFICDAERGIFAVIDGVGGHAGGEVAAAIARRELELRLRRETGTVEDRIREAIAAANASILAEAARVPALRGMACVLTAAVATSGRLTAGHVGDTRLYKLDARRMRKLTRDHSPVGLLEDSGQVSEAEAMAHPDRNQVFREVGTTPRQPTDGEFIDVVVEPLGPDEAILLCSDGLTDLVPAATIEAAVRRHGSDPAAAVGELLAAANAAGGRDNVTAIVAAGPRFAAAGERFSETRGAPDGSLVAAATIAQGAAGAVVQPAPRSWPWVAAACVAVLAYAAAAWWWSGAAGSARTPGGVTAPHVMRVSPAQDAEFATIAAAMAVAQPGDTIEVAPGTYAEAVTLREGVFLRARPRRAAVLRPPSSEADAWTAITAHDLRSGGISGFVIEGSAEAPLDYGISVTNADVELDDLEVSGARVAGIHIAGPSAAVVRSSHLHGNPGAGILIEADASPEILHNTIAGHDGGPAGAAIDVRPGARALIAHNVIRGAGGAGVMGLPPAELAQVRKANAFISLGAAGAAAADQPHRRTPATGGRSGGARP